MDLRQSEINNNYHLFKSCVLKNILVNLNKYSLNGIYLN